MAANVSKKHVMFKPIHTVSAPRIQIKKRYIITGSNVKFSLNAMKIFEFQVAFKARSIISLYENLITFCLNPGQVH